jgi:hypothetical protein
MKNIAIIIWASVAICFLGIEIIAIINFFVEYSKDVVLIKDILSAGIILIASTINIIAALLIFVLWIFIDQINKLKIFIDDTAEKVTELLKTVKTTKENLDLLL